MKHLITALFVMVACASIVPAAEQADVPVPILKAPFHLPVFKNEYVTLLNIYVPPGRNTGFHTHTGDSVSVSTRLSVLYAHPPMAT